VRAAYIDALGPAAAITYGELPDPEPAADQVLVRVEAVAVDMVDTYLRSGRWPTPLSLPVAVGRDLVGVVAGTGAAVTDVQAGRRVWTNSAGYGGRPGATAELVAVDRERLYPLPEGADPVRFVAAVHPGATAHGVLLGRARLRPGETVAVVGANGAVGVCLVQLAARYGAEVVAVVRNAAAAGRLRELGARHVVVAEAAVAAAAAAAVAPRGVDVFVDTSRHVDLATVPERLEPRGRIVLVAGEGTTELDLWRFYVREIQLLGFVMSQMTVPELAAAAEWINAAPPRVGVGRVLGFADAARAHSILEGGELPRMPDGTVGRIVLRP
jgi:NADPH:quinone reductase-like Zn-dependent oxidoreductase